MVGWDSVKNRIHENRENIRSMIIKRDGDDALIKSEYVICIL